jgi:hypothetical protein
VEAAKLSERVAIHIIYLIELLNNNSMKTAAELEQLHGAARGRTRSMGIAASGTPRESTLRFIAFTFSCHPVVSVPPVRPALVRRHGPRRPTRTAIRGLRFRFHARGHPRTAQV